MVGLVDDRCQLALLLHLKVWCCQQDVGIHRDHAQHIVKIVGDPCRQLAHRRQPFLDLLIALLLALVGQRRRAPAPRPYPDRQDPDRRQLHTCTGAPLIRQTPAISSLWQGFHSGTMGPGAQAPLAEFQLWFALRSVAAAVPQQDRPGESDRRCRPVPGPLAPCRRSAVSAPPGRAPHPAAAVARSCCLPFLPARAAAWLVRRRRCAAAAR